MREICITLLLLFCMPVFADDCSNSSVAFDTGYQMTVDDLSVTPLDVPEPVPITDSEKVFHLTQMTACCIGETAIASITRATDASAPFEVGWRRV